MDTNEHAEAGQQRGLDENQAAQGRQVSIWGRIKGAVKKTAVYIVMHPQAIVQVIKKIKGS